MDTKILRAVLIMTVAVSVLLLQPSSFIPGVKADVRVNSLAKLGFSDKQLERQPNLKYKSTGGGNRSLRADAEVYPYQVPSNFGYKKLERREENNNDRSLRDNIDNEANQRNVSAEAPKDMTPCRQDEGRPRQALKLTAGDTVDIPLQFNNPHDGEAEINLWKNAGTDKAQVATIARFDAGGGYSQNRPSFKLPDDAPECKPEDKCLMQFYWHTVEPRTYAICSDLEITPKAAGGGGADDAQKKTGGGTDRALRYTQDNSVENQGPIAAAVGTPSAAAPKKDGAAANGNKGGAADKGGGGKQAATNPGSSLKEYPVNFKDPIYYSDSFHTAHIDSTHSGYQGQDPDNVSDNMKARIYLNDATGNGGLLKDALPRKTIQAKNKARNEVNAAIKNEEKKAIKSNKSAQLNLLKTSAVAALTGGPSAAAADNGGKGQLPGYESDRYSDVLNPRRRRQYTNTYVTNVDTQKIADNFKPELEAKGLYPQSVAVKDTYKNTEVYGMKKNNLKAKGNADKLPEAYKKALGPTSNKLLKVRSLGGDEEAEMADDVAMHDTPVTSQYFLKERAFQDPTTQPGGDLSLSEAEKSALLSSAAISDDSADLGGGDSALDQKIADDEDPGDNPDDANDDNANAEAESNSDSEQ